MDRAEASEVLGQHLDRLQALGFDALARRIGDLEVLTQPGQSGVEYQLELDVRWDRERGGVIRIFGSMDDGGLEAFLPLTDSRLVSPDAGPSTSGPRTTASA